MNDEQIIEYLRSRSRAVPPAELPQALMAAVETAPAPRSWFASLIPAAAAVGAAGMLLVVALLIGQPPGLTPEPSGSEQPTPPPSVTPTASPTSSPPPSPLSLVQPGASVEIPAVDDSGEWGTIRIERGDDLGGYPDAAIDPELFVIEFFISYTPERTSEPAQFGSSDWALRAADPNAEHFFVIEPRLFERTDGAGSRPESALGNYIFSTPTEGTIAFDVPRREANLALELVYLRTGEAFAARDPGEPPEPVAAPTSSMDAESAARAAAEAAAAAAAAEVLFMTADGCTNPIDGYTVSFPDDWYTNTETGDVAACSWFTPEFFEVTTPGVAPDEIWIHINVFDGVVGYITPLSYREEITVDGRAGHIAELNSDPHARPDYRVYQYIVPLGENGPTLAAATSSDAGDYALAKAVLDRIMASFEFSR